MFFISARIAILEKIDQIFYLDDLNLFHALEWIKKTQKSAIFTISLQILNNLLTIFKLK